VPNEFVSLRVIMCFSRKLWGVIAEHQMDWYHNRSYGRAATEDLVGKDVM
jgi:hypothetical protein